MKKTRQKFFLKSIALLIFFLGITPTLLFAQSTIRGKVVDESNQPLPGAGVQLKKSGKTTTTDNSGEFSISVTDDEAAFIVSYVGFTAKETQIIRGTSVYRVILIPDAKNLTEVVVVGYGQQKKSDVTGSVAGIKGETLLEVPAANPIAALQGRIAGVDISRSGTRPGAGGQIRIRGNRSLSGTSDPLIILDGVPFNGSVNEINNADIASIDILKDASSTAIYGFRGSNGVILITTKRGKIGKPQLNYNAYYGLSNVRDQYNQFNGQEFVAFRNAASPAYTAGYSPLELAGIANGTSTNWQDYLYNTAHVTDQQLSVSGGSEAVNYGVSAGYFNESGVVTGIGFERYALNTTIDATISKRIKIGLSTRNTLTYGNGAGVNPLYATMRITPLAPVRNADGSIYLYPQDGTVDQTATANPLTLDDTNNIVDRTRRLRTNNVLYGEVNILEGLKYKLNLGLDFRQENRGTFFGPKTIIRPDATTAAQATASVSNNEAYTLLIENILTYNKTFAENHRVDFTGLFSTQRDRGFSNAFNGVGFPSEAVQYYNFFLAQTITPVDGGAGGFSRGGLISFMGRVNYAYKDKYLATITFRRDGSSVFPVNPYLNYPAAAIGWNVINEDFMKNQKVVSNLKIRASYGVTGNPSIPTDATRGSLQSNRYNYGTENVQGYYIGSLANLDLRWESTKQFNLGVDFGFLDNRITGSVDLYKQNTDDLIINKQLPRSNGATSFFTNAAATSGRGIEFNLSTQNIVAKDRNGFTWSSDFNFAINREKIVRLADASTIQDIGNGWFVGQPLNVIYDYTKAGIWQTSEAVEAARFGAVPGQIKIADISGSNGVPDGAITDADRSIIGTFQPKIVLGMTQRVSYKGFDLSTVIFSRIGNKIVVPYLTTDGGTSGYFAFLNGRVNQVKVDYWTPTNPTNAFPRPAGGATNLPYSSTLGYYDGSFVKVRSINLGYNFTEKIASKIGLSGLRVFATANNPFILYSPFVKSGLGIDPEGTGVGGALANNAIPNGRAITVGLDLPSTRQFLFGINAKF
ncbi:MAG: TonB-dependent receptor [Bacteroidota bacterium]|jgi:TonB-dependent starch-binding outer membrane protein SusC|uniref:TonB-dependent receptor n=1 Tax=Pedobacter cryotolerans TaxID=2571270 RepID=A0A4U1BWF2_9SPHI|nr:TonB-dependent receptor [Pedobacter cryotolerans]TKB96642.1 TonB-dependent receptor [Pedobacter cryotolerans]